jgi:hypothetical protein
LGGPRVRDNWKDLGVGGRITLKWTLGREKLGRPRRRWEDNVKMDLRERDNWEDLGVGGRITLKWTLGRETTGRT